MTKTTPRFWVSAQGRRRISSFLRLPDPQEGRSPSPPKKLGDRLFERLEQAVQRLAPPKTAIVPLSLQVKKENEMKPTALPNSPKPAGLGTAKPTSNPTPKPAGVSKPIRAAAPASTQAAATAAPKKPNPVTEPARTHKAAKPQLATQTKPQRLDLPRRKIPQDVRDTLKGKTYASWSSFRRAVNREWSKSPSTRNDPFFTQENLDRMKRGLNPRSPEAGHLGRRGAMEYDHKIERRDGGATYDPRNLTLRTPRSHSLKISRKFGAASKDKLTRE